MKKFVSAALAVMMIFCCVAFSASAEGEGDKALKFNSDGTFKVLQIADIQDSIIFRGLTKTFIIDLLEKEQPDLVVLTGDNVGPGTCKTYGMTWININNFMSIFEEYNVPVAIVYGNHDADRNLLSKEAQWEIYESYDCFVGRDDSEELTGYGTYYLPVMSSDGQKQAFTFWFFDSQQENTENDLGGYGCVGKDQIDWYVRTENSLTEANGGEPIPSFAFQHIIPPEIFDTFYKLWETDKETGAVTIVGNPDMYREGFISEYNNATYVFPEEYVGEDTFFSENPAPPKYSNGQADALAETGNVLGIAVGHDHMNSFVVPYKDLDIVQTPTASFGSYGDDNRGARILVFNENNPDEYETDVIFFRDYYDLSDEELYNRYVFNSDSVLYSSTDRFVAMCRYIFLRTVRVITEAFTIVC